LEATYETEFKGFSYGFWPGRIQHNVLDALYMAVTTRKVSWVLDADIKGFGAIDHGGMMGMRRELSAVVSAPSSW
jgi:retron-type reverse transcriptase